MIPSYSSLALFLAGAIVLLLTPGPAVLYIVSRTVGQGRAAGLVSAGGIAVGTLFHVTAAVLGLSALLVSSAHAFRVVQLAGAAYLIFLGVRTLTRREETDGAASPEAGHSLRRIFSQGIVVNVLNPKSALFFLAFLPQFVDPHRGHITAQILFLGILFAVMGLCSDSCWALLANQVSARLRSSSRLQRAQKNLSGGVLIALGLATAVSGSRAK
jgi:threonine/homoserine/homoserine lactone efflux protein